MPIKDKTLHENENEVLNNETSQKSVTQEFKANNKEGAINNTEVVQEFKAEVDAKDLMQENNMAEENKDIEGSKLTMAETGVENSKIDKEKIENKAEPTSGEYDENIFCDDNQKEINFREDLDRLKNNDNTKQLLENAGDTIQKSNSKKKKWLNFIFLAINIIVLVIIVAIQASKEDGMLSFPDLFTLAGDRMWFLLLAVCGFFMWMGLKSLRVYFLIYSSTKTARPFLSYKTCAIGKYYDNLTPLATGGQPFQIYYMMRRGIKGATATTIPMAKYIYSQLIFVIVCACVIIFSEKIVGNLSPVIFTMSVIGLCINAGLMGIVLFLSISKKVGPWITKSIFKLCYKMKLIKNYDESLEKTMLFVAEYRKTMKSIITNIPTTLVLLSNSFLIICVQCLIPFFICCTFTTLPINFDLYGAVFILIVVIESAISFIPWPGAAGFAEVSFLLLFSHPLIGLQAGTITYAIIIWRLLQYYSFLIQGLLIMLYDYLFGSKKIPKTIEYFKSKNKMQQ